MNTVTVREMTQDQARAITNKIRSRTEELWVLIKAAYDGKAWKALGYHGWGDYARTEFDVSRSRAYQLIDQAKVITELKKVSTMVDISERDARAIKPVITEVAAEIKAKVDGGADPVETTYSVIEARRVDAPKPSKQVEKPEPEQDEGPTLAELVDELQAENTRLTELIKASEADDLKAEAIKWRAAYEHAKREHGVAMDNAAKSHGERTLPDAVQAMTGKRPGSKPAKTDPRDAEIAQLKDALDESRANARELAAMVEATEFAALPDDGPAKEIKRLLDEIATLKSQRDGYMTKCNELIKTVKHWKHKAGAK